MDAINAQNKVASSAPTKLSSPQFCTTDGSLNMLSGQTCGWTILEYCTQLFQGYRATGGVLLANPDSQGREPLKEFLVHSACTQHGDELMGPIFKIS